MVRERRGSVASRPECKQRDPTRSNRKRRAMRPLTPYTYAIRAYQQLSFIKVVEGASEGVRPGQNGDACVLRSLERDHPPLLLLLPPSLPTSERCLAVKYDAPGVALHQMEISTRASSLVKWEGSVAPARSSPPPPPPPPARQLCATLQALGRSLFYPLLTFLSFVVGLLFRRHPTTNLTPFRSEPVQIFRQFV